MLRLEYAYDDIGRALTQTSFDAASGGNITSQVKYTYDAWGNVIKTQQAHDGAVTDATPAVQYSYEDGAVNGQAAYVRLRSMTYPNGRVIYYNYDSTPVERLSSISDDAAGTSVLVQYAYLGASTVTRVSHPGVNGGLDLSYGSAGNYTGWDRFGQVIGQSWKRNDGTVIDGYAYTYDRNGNRTSKANQMNSALSESYSYDGLDRLASVQQNGSADQAWNLDALGNWAGFTDQGTSQTRTADAANQTTSISGGWVTPTYDAAGNMTSGPKAGDETTRLHFTYDAWNRLIAVQADDNGQPGATLATYRYDARGYRIQKVVGADTTDFYYNDNWQVVQETKNAQVYAQYVWDIRYIDACVCRDRASNGDGVLDERLYYVQDGNFNTTALVDANGNVVERYACTAYGQMSVYDGVWNVRTGGSAVDNQVAYAGYRFDPETGLSYSRHRYYQPTLGVWISRDPAGYVDGAHLYQYVRSGPVGSSDPSGLQGFRLNRIIGAGPDTQNGMFWKFCPVSHTFIYTADLVTEDIFDCAGNPIGTSTHWKLLHTYSWGNAADTHTWHKDQAEDINAAQQAIHSNYMGSLVGENTPEFDAYLDKAYDLLSPLISENHMNGLISDTCKNAAFHLEIKALDLWKAVHSCGFDLSELGGGGC